jgi:hypothetical protein
VLWDGRIYEGESIIIPGVFYIIRAHCINIGGCNVDRRMSFDCFTTTDYFENRRHIACIFIGLGVQIMELLNIRFPEPLLSPFKVLAHPSAFCSQTPSAYTVSHRIWPDNLLDKAGLIELVVSVCKLNFMLRGIKVFVYWNKGILQTGTVTKRLL